MNSRDSSKLKDLNGLSSKMYQGSSIVTTEKISSASSKSWMNSGMVFRGEFSMQNILEHPKDVAVSTLSEVLETSAPQRYFLNKAQLESLLNRASAKNHQMNEALESKIKRQISLLSNTPQLDANQLQDLKQKATGMMEKPTLSTQGGARTLYVRRLLPSECEVLQGFPKGWTETDTER